MKILHVIPAVARRYGGPSSAIVPMCRSLAAQGLQPFIATTDADGPGRLDMPIGVPTLWEGVPAIFFRRDCSEAYKYSYGLGRWLARRAGDFAVAHLHAALSYAPLAAATACRRAAVPYVVRPLGTMDAWSLQQKPIRKRLLLAMGGRRMLRDAAAIHYTSSEERRQAERALGLERGVVIPLGIDETLLSEPLASADERLRDSYVLVLSRLHPVKNLESLIEAFAGITAGQNVRIPWRLVVAGTGDPEYLAVLQRLVVSAGAQRRVSFAGWVEGEAKQRLIRNASLFALPSLHENFGVSLVEALAAGVPALVSRQVHLADAVEAAGAGWVVDGDHASLRAGLADALDDAQERESRGRAARELARRFSWTGVGAQLLELYQQLVSSTLPQLAPSLQTGREGMSTPRV
jgi:glycosyltransferase involved in cell wall biosynthesis